MSILIAKLLVLTSIMKILCCAAPLLKDGKYGGEIAESIAQSMNYLPTKLSSVVQKILEKLPSLGADTHENVRFLTSEVVEEIWDKLIMS